MRSSGARRTLARLARNVSIVANVLLCACADDPSILDVRLANGISVSEGVRMDATTIVLVYEPEMCFSCSPMFTRWESSAKRQGARLLLLLSGQPSSEAARALRRLRVPVAGVAVGWPKRLVPAEYVFRRGELLGKAEGIPEMQRRKLWEKPWPAP